MVDSEPELIEGRAAFAARAEEFVGAARLEILLLSFDLDRALYGGAGFVEVIKHFALASERAKFHVLLNQPQRPMQGAHRLIELGRRLPSRIAFRELLPERRGRAIGEQLIADESAVLIRESPDALEARGWRAAPMLARETRTAFLRLWEESPPARELQVLRL